MAKIKSNESKTILDAVDRFISSLSIRSKMLAIIDFNSNERFNWHYIPKDRKGLCILEMTDQEKSNANNLLQVLLSPSGFVTANKIIQHEIILGEIEESKKISRFTRDPRLYYFSIFVSGNSFDTLGVRVEGHHLSINISILKNNLISVTPNFFGANPALVKSGENKAVRILDKEEDLSNEIFLSFNKHQLFEAIIYDEAPDDLITKTDFQILLDLEIGLSSDKMTDFQIRKLYDLIDIYINRNPDFFSQKLSYEVKGFPKEKIFFAWAGSTELGKGNYYRISTPSIFIEYDNTQDEANHIHSVIRYRGDDFAINSLAEHYKKYH
jgi:hypothetical protein